MSRTRTISLLFAMTCALATGCGKSGIGDGDAIDSSVLPPLIDAAPRADAMPPPPDAASVDCPPGLPAQFGDLGFRTASNKGMFDGMYKVFITLNQDPNQLLVIGAAPGRGVFKDGVVPGTYEIQGMDTDYQYCSACVFMFADYPQPPGLHLMAEKGELTVTALNGDKLSGSITDVSFRPIEIVYDDQSVQCPSGDDSTCVNTICLAGQCGRQSNLDGCHTAISSMSF